MRLLCRLGFHHWVLAKELPDRLKWDCDHIPPLKQEKEHWGEWHCPYCHVTKVAQWYYNFP